SINDHPAFRKLISYGSLSTETARTGVIGRDASVADRMFIEDQFFLLEMVRVKVCLQSDGMLCMPF
ncbi:hypothetical protein PM726_08680, partial [Enterococcus faecium]|nr:hypothetical protein [Enterococcus faecium]MDB7251078.1 hypothetical protein [Enterococcus faecium]MDB7261315.1 hypothetical protein [Enterococcus faecium]MDQ8429811.1 hypothetical protein [Enterococcus faecium]